ncbi:hypothetical protein LCGC14_2110940, partial [marine sediment metagenome]
MRSGYCHECNEKFRLLDRYKVADDVWECPHCD